MCRIFVCAIWAIWTSRNRWIHKGRKKSRAETVKFIKQYIHEAIACVQAVTVGRDLGITHAEIERDCLTIIKKVQNT